jgi:hypothetical protein
MFGLSAATIGWYWAASRRAGQLGAARVCEHRPRGITVFAAGDTPISVWGFAALRRRRRSRRGRGRLGIVSDLTWGSSAWRPRGIRPLVRELGEGHRPGGHSTSSRSAAPRSHLLGDGVIAAALVPPSMVFRRVLGWGMVVAGFGIGTSRTPRRST